jgi:polyisoprenoid-binding protein YceI
MHPCQFSASHKVMVSYRTMAWIATGCLLATAAASRTIDTEKSVMTIRVYKSGFFSAFGHNHDIAAPIAEGSFDEANPSVRLRIDSRRLRVIDKDVSEQDRTKIQETMLGPEVLDSRRFPEIVFESDHVQRLGEGKWEVEGKLTLHGQTHPIRVQIEGQGGRYRGWAQLKQKDFGITPVAVAGGTVRVKNEVRIEFDILGK